MVWHEDWRDVEGRRAVYRSYGAGQGVLYGKYLRRGDLYVALRVARDVLAGAALAGRMIRSRRREPAAAWFAGFFGGILRGLRLRRL
jgi:hypothetical protein